MARSTKLGDARVTAAKAEAQRQGKAPVDRANPAPSSIPTREQTALARQTSENAANPQPSPTAPEDAREAGNQRKAQAQSMSATETLAKQEQKRADEQAKARRTAQEEAQEEFAKAKLAAQKEAAKLGWSIYPDEEPRDNQTVMIVNTDPAGGSSIIEASFRKGGPSGDGTFYANDAGSFSRMLSLGKSVYWRETIAAPPPMPRAPRPV